jgi:hypothetical protein
MYAIVCIYLYIYIYTKTDMVGGFELCVFNLWMMISHKLSLFFRGIETKQRISQTPESPADVLAFRGGSETTSHIKSILEQTNIAAFFCF